MSDSNNQPSLPTRIVCKDCNSTGIEFPTLPVVEVYYVKGVKTYETSFPAEHGCSKCHCRGFVYQEVNQT